ncbi:MAG: hypothetical protein A3F84_04365 [Candidatus Handelsmanbacteria bacterium RIFCSPLOWO2_12_FULL_64_10]|uniref:Uncharacterized protein n=1 Tax=Handelsmanbacteria sp. (strain RIFCSPLOWO2_12_FULL_64_10) TaxID=1817868 RepID=A0A1F6D430_HANXR|nr:MAG: hypothetical protein A3F84_04365 [Candidatus Handelsmanbacteria bacterium RIFCSPLOWO2_12_FULL_64_10]
MPQTAPVPYLRSLARTVADAADADQYAVAVVGVPQTGNPDFEELVPRESLEAMADGAPARYRLTLVLQSDSEDLAVVRLATLRPHGFTDLDVGRARAVARLAADELSRTLAVWSAIPA